MAQIYKIDHRLKIPLFFYKKTNISYILSAILKLLMVVFSIFGIKI